MKYALIGMVVMTAVLYIQRAVLYYRALKRQTEKQYGERIFDDRKTQLAKRAALWCVPARIYHWRERRWRRKFDDD